MTNKPKIVTMSRIINALRKSREQTLDAGPACLGVGFPTQNGVVGAAACRPSSDLKEFV